MFRSHPRATVARRVFALAAAVATAVGITIAADASAASASVPASSAATLPYGMNQATYTRMIAQIPLDAAADRIQTASAKPGAGHDGFFDTWVDADRHTVTLYWHGAMPSDIARLVHTLGRTVTIHVATARYSMAQLNAAVRKGLSTTAAVSGHPLNDGSGIQLDFGAHPAAAPAVDSLATAVGVPVRTGIGGPVTLQATCVPTGQTALAAPSRCDDRSPGYWGGDIIINPTGNAACTTAFGVHDSSGNTYMLTAAHCSENASKTPVNGLTFYNGDETQTMGKSLDVPGTHDDALIATSAGNEYYDGPGITQGDTHNTKTVVGQQGTSIGDWLCESGGFGGVICGIHVEAVNVAPKNDPWNSLTEALSTTGKYTISGDSGGPYFSLAGTGTVTAKGVHEGLQLDDSGNTVETFTPMNVVTNDTGVTVNTG